MFGLFKRKKNYKDKKDVYKSIINKLDDISNWCYEDKQGSLYNRYRLYYHKDQMVNLRRDGGKYGFTLLYPVYFEGISSKIIKLLDEIDKNENNVTQFICDFIDDDFSCSIVMNDTKYNENKNDIRTWLHENSENGFYIDDQGTRVPTSKVFIWFKLEEDAMAFKLRWI